MPIYKIFIQHLSFDWASFEINKTFMNIVAVLSHTKFEKLPKTSKEFTEYSRLLKKCLIFNL